MLTRSQSNDFLDNSVQDIVLFYKKEYGALVNSGQVITRVLCIYVTLVSTHRLVVFFSFTEGSMRTHY